MAEAVAYKTDGVPAMLGVTSEFKVLLCDIARNITGLHSILHQEALALRTLPDDLKAVLDIAGKTNNYIKANPLKLYLFGLLFQDMVVHWLSQGKVLDRIFKLQAEVAQFLRE